MLKTILAHKLRFFYAAILVLLLAFVRIYEKLLFYDPFLDYFKGEFHSMPLPVFDSFNLFLSLLFRYGLNTFLSLGLLYVVFKDFGMVQFASVLYLVFFVVLIISFFAVIFFYREHNNLLLFYVRRFLIQPVFVLLFIPAFYFQKLNK